MLNHRADPDRALDADRIQEGIGQDNRRHRFHRARGNRGRSFVLYGAGVRASQKPLGQTRTMIRLPANFERQRLRSNRDTPDELMERLMAMAMTGEIQLAAPREAVWAKPNDPAS